MKNTFLICLFTLFVLSGCTDDDTDLLAGGNTSPELLPENKPNATVDATIFEKLNLDYSGLEKVKEYYEKEEYYYAANALLEYYRTRTNVANPNLSLMNVSIVQADQDKADYALDNYRFYVNNYEDGKDGKPYSVKKDGAIDWTFSPQGASNEYQAQLHRHQWFIPQAKVYRHSGDEKYINSWIEVYSDWIRNNPKPEGSPNDITPWEQLQVSSRISDQVQLLEYYKNSVNFTPEWLTTFLTSFAEQTDYLAEYLYPGSGNILIAQATALTTAGILMPELKNAENWLNTGYSLMNTELQHQFLSDGWHKEFSLHYHIGTLNNFYEILTLAIANKQTDKLSADFKESLRKAAEVVMHFTYPNYFLKGSDNVVPMFNDSWSRTRNVLKNKNFKPYVELFPDSEELRYMQTAGNGGTAEGKTPGNEMKLFDQAGFYILRNGWDPSSTVMIFSNNKSNDISNSLKAWSHNQADNGTFELYINKRNFFPDSGVCKYYTDGGSNDIRNWFRGIDKHNTMSLYNNSNGWYDNISYAEGKLLLAEEGTTEKLVFENQGYDNLKHRRAVFYVNKEFFVLIDEGIGNASGKIALSFNLCEGKNTEVIVDDEAFGAHTAFNDNNNIIVRTFTESGIQLACEKFTGRVAYGWKGGDDGEYNERNAYRITQQKQADKTARFITVILPTGDTDKNINATFLGDYNESGASVQVEIEGYPTYTLSYDLPNQ
ncbi:heparin-sulfate lyase HepC [uncultured Bacteroides sp.]|jgi:heparinase III protein|uniref:heparin-sulfate lyase HepC n=1 Tax=uncultured Bacteroides sp. TaxID=162156 RepID=UPI00280A5CAC|nr:heparin-sulfate lyase HepC [uncultured Bacteroides sp.]